MHDEAYSFEEIIGGFESLPPESTTLKGDENKVLVRPNYHLDMVVNGVRYTKIRGIILTHNGMTFYHTEAFLEMNVEEVRELEFEYEESVK